MADAPTPARQLVSAAALARRESSSSSSLKRAREAEAPSPPAKAAAAAAAATAPFRGPCADSQLGELFLDVIGLVAARGYAAEVSQCRALCGLTWRRGSLGATNDMIVSSLRLQCGATQAREAVRESFNFATPWALETIEGSTQLIRAAIQNNLPRVLQLVQLGAPLGLVDENYSRSAPAWASELGHERVAMVLLEGKYKGAGVDQVCNGWTALERASYAGHAGVVRALLARGAKLVRPAQDYVPMFWAVTFNHVEVVKQLLAAPDAKDALKAKDRDGHTPLKRAFDRRHTEIVALLRAAGAPEE